MAKIAKKQDPRLWDEVKRRVTKGSKGGEPGQWSARKAQLATAEYKKRGGRYSGAKPADNSLSQWTREEWGTKSGRRSKDTGERYLPKKARERLTSEEYARSTAKKRKDKAAGRQVSRQPADVARKAAAARRGDERTKAELMQEARHRGIAGRSRMDKQALRRALA
jgi:hypothetical protein